MKLKITIDDHTYEVEVEAAEPESPAAPPPRGYAVEPAPVRMPAAAPPRPVDAGPQVNEDKVARSPITGTVVRVLAQPGQSIQVGDVLLVLEAMKMETNITAPVDAKVAEVNVAVGDAVRAGQVLVEFA